MQTRCPYNQWLCGHHVNVVKDYKDTKSTKSLRTQCRRSQRHSVSIVNTGYSRTSLWNKKRLQNRFCLFIWSPGRVLWPRKGRKSRDIVLLRPNKLSPITLPLSIVSKIHFDSQGQFLSYFSLVACRNMQNWRMPSSAYVTHIKNMFLVLDDGNSWEVFPLLQHLGHKTSWRHSRRSQKLQIW